MSSESVVSVSAVTDRFSELRIHDPRDEKELKEMESAPLSQKIALIANFLFSVQKGDSPLFQKSVLNEMQYVYTITQDALRALLELHLEAFDALVSDCACQIRGLMVTKVALRAIVDKEFRREIETLVKQLDAKAAEVGRMAAGTSQKAKIKPSKMAEFLAANKFEFQVAHEVFMLATTHLLSKSKVVTQKPVRCSHPDCLEWSDHDIEVTNPYIINGEANLVSNKRKETIVKEAKKWLAAASCKAIQSEASRHSDLVTRAALGKVRVVEARNEVPAYYSLKTVFESLLASNTPLFVMVMDAPHTVDGGMRDPVLVNLLMKPDGDQRDFVVVRPTAEDEARPCLLIKGQRSHAKVETQAEFIARFAKTSFMTIVKTFCAAHPQFTDVDGFDTIPLFDEALQNRTSPIYEPVLKEREEVLRQRELSAKLGVNMSHQELFCMVHIGATTVAAQRKRGRVVYEPRVSEGAV